MSDYAPVTQDEDELEPRSRYLDYAAEGQYPPVSPAPAAPAPAPGAASGYQPVESPAAPAMSSMGSLGDLESRADRPKTAIQDETAPPVTPRPQWKDYAPAEPHGWGKVGHVLAAMTGPTNKIFNTDPEHRAEANYKNASAEYEAPVAEEHVKAESGELEQRGKKEGAEATALANPQDWKGQPGIVNDQGAPLELNEKTGQYRWGQVTGAQPIKPPATTSEQNKETFQHKVGVLRGEGLLGPQDVTDFKKIAGALTNSKQLTDQDKNDMTGYMAANGTPATNLQVHIEGAQATNAMKEAGKTYLYNGELVRGDKVPSTADATLIKDPQAFQSEARNADIITKSFNHLVNDDHRIFDDPKARAVLATALDDRQAQEMGLMVAGTGGTLSLPSGSGKIIDQLLENHAVPETLRRSVKDYIVDYWAMKDKLMMVQMEMQNGKMGKGNQAYFQAMVSQLPGPATSDSTMARRSLSDLSETLNGLRGTYGNLTKETATSITGSVGGGGHDYGVTDKPEGSTGKLKDGTRVTVKNGRIIGL